MLGDGQFDLFRTGPGLPVDGRRRAGRGRGRNSAARARGLYERRWPQHLPWRPLAIFLRQDAAIVAGLAGETYCGWLFVKYLWVCEELRGRGVGRELMARAEACAREHGCHSALLDTFSFQARGFYEKLGYKEFGRLDYPPGRSRHFLQKQLAAAG